MEEAQQNAIRANLEELLKNLDLCIIYDLFAKGVLQEYHMDIINNEKTDKGKRLKLLETVQTRDNAWNLLLQTMEKNSQAGLAQKLRNSIQSSIHYGSAFMTLKPIIVTFFMAILAAVVLNLMFNEGKTIKFANPIKQQLYETVRQKTLSLSENVRDGIWGDFLLTTNLENIYQPLQIIESNAARSLEQANRFVSDYEYLQQDNVESIFIEGVSGIGKSTYCKNSKILINKLSLIHCRSKILLPK